MHEVQNKRVDKRFFQCDSFQDSRQHSALQLPFLKEEGPLESAGLKTLQERTQLYEGVLHHILSGALITDPDGYIIFFSDTYGKFLGMDPKDQIGKHTINIFREPLISGTQVADSEGIGVIRKKSQWKGGVIQEVIGASSELLHSKFTEGGRIRQ
jgi:transcriptional regulator with PAS, ATPase and Fis domain